MLITIAMLADSRPTDASTLEKWLIMPGPVVRSHENIESDCKLCHDPLSDRPQFELCVTCHADVGDDLVKNTGLHGRLHEAQRLECADCHTDHEGRDAIIVDVSEDSFDHALTDFILSGAHTELACSNCHADGDKHRQAPSTCFGCHRADDPHEEQLGRACDSCHGTSNWAVSGFDHATTGFPLTGMHDGLDCTACHRSNDSKMLTTVGRSCTTCHQADDKHEGRNGSLCADCHNADTWKSPTFNHQAVAGFRLDGGHRGLTCQDCHSSRDYRDLGGSNCVSCHRADDVHKGRNGSDCASCHVAASWRATQFDHASHANLSLPPGHETLECKACHTSDVHEQIPRTCAGCHTDEDAHQGQLGTQCEGCHVATNWISKVWFDHDLASFPLLGAHAGAACDRCHASAAFHDADSDCVACHASDDPHRGAFSRQCDACHNPSVWQSWQFDHDTQSSFALSGAHADVACGDCHTSPLGGRSGISGDCVSCHRREDPHSGRFGKNCDSCHNVSSFSQIEGR